MRQKDAGFTLLELLVTIAVAGILIGIAAPNFAKMIADARLARVQTDMEQTLYYARNVALNRKQIVRICGIDPALPDACIGGEKAWNSGWKVVADGTAGPEVLLRMPLTPGQFRVRFDANGYWSYTGGMPLAFAPATTDIFRPAVGWAKMTICDSRGADSAQWVVVEGTTSRAPDTGTVDGQLPQGGAIYKSTAPGQAWAGYQVVCGL